MDANGIILPAAPAPIQISFADVPPQTTAQFVLGMNFDSRETPPATALFSPTDPTSYNFSTSGNTFDSLGQRASASRLYFVKTATAGQWQMYGTVDGIAPANVNLGAGAGQPGDGELQQHRPAHHRACR